MRMDEMLNKVFSQEDTAETAWMLTECRFHVIPVKARSDEWEKQKRPCYPYSANHYMDKTTPWKEIEKAFRDERRGIALVPHLGCGVIIIDADTPDEVNALRIWWKEQTGGELPEPTVKTPGVQDGVDWKHKEGGHWYITYSRKRRFDGQYAKYQNISRGDSHFCVRLYGAYNIIPPTERYEGSYVHNAPVINGEVDNIAQTLISYCRKSQPEYTPRKVRKPERFVRSGHYDFRPGMPLDDRIAVWTQHEDHISRILDLPGFTAESSGCIGSDCQAVHYESSSQSRSAIVHGRHCTVPYGTMTIFSGSLASELDTDEGKTKACWNVINHFLYNDNIQECIRGEGLHVDVKYGSQDYFQM